jgi:small subunit ribosomal protein S6
MVVYEGMFILDPTKYSRDPAAITQQVADLITQHGGTILAARLWDERKLAYPINGHKKGVYWLTYFKMPGAGVTPLERHALAGNEAAASKRAAPVPGPVAAPAAAE